MQDYQNFLEVNFDFDESRCRFVKQLSKPIASRLKVEAARSERVSDGCASVGQVRWNEIVRSCVFWSIILGHTSNFFENQYTGVRLSHSWGEAAPIWNRRCWRWVPGSCTVSRSIKNFHCCFERYYRHQRERDVHNRREYYHLRICKEWIEKRQESRAGGRAGSQVR